MQQYDIKRIVAFVLATMLPIKDAKAEPTNAFIGAEYEIAAEVAKAKLRKREIS